MNIRSVQAALRRAGFDPGPIDGIEGPLTRAAIRAFQAHHGLKADGIAGPRTLARLRRRRLAVLPWMHEAQRLIGTAEAAGAVNNPLILDWAKQAGMAYGADEIPWCGLFAAHCLKTALPGEPLPANPLLARQWAGFGREAAPQPGAVMVFWRGSKAGWTGHVGFYWAEDDSHFHILGGNQSDRVSIARLARSRLLAARWPLTAPLASAGPRLAGAGAAAVSQGEA